MINLIAVETKEGYYITREKSPYSNNLQGLMFDGIPASSTFHKDWGYVMCKPIVKVSHIETQPNINHRFVLKDDTLSPKLPLEILKDDAGEYIDTCDGKTFIWKDELAQYRSLYVEVSDEQPDKEVGDEFALHIAFVVEDIKPPPEFRYPCNEYYDRWADGNKRTNYVTNGNIEHQLLDRIIFPKIILHNTPCRISSEESYEIVRGHIKRNIDNKVAKVRSDYNFCFDVVKIINIEPYQVTREYTPPRCRKPRTSNRMVSSREVPVFEMTYSPYNYKGYTPIQAFEADTEEELKIQVDNYLAELMEVINKPLKDCPNCKGTGVITDNH